MLVMGIESSAHTFGVGIVDGGKVLANEKEMYKIGAAGMIPSKVAEFHSRNFSNVISRALESASVNIRDIEGIGYTKGPGLGPCLQVGELAAKTIAKGINIPIAEVHHGVAHIEITKLAAKLRDPVALYVSGGNSQILKKRREPFSHYHVLGETFDIGVGNMLDSFARVLGLKPAWGSSIEKKAMGGSYIRLPYTVKGMDFSFTGLLTKASSMVGKARTEDLCYSVQETAFAMLCEATERALMLTGADEMCVCGGVAQSATLRKMLEMMASEHHIRFGFAPNEYNADNGAMIAYVAERMINEGLTSKISECGIMQKYRIDSVEVPW